MLVQDASFDAIGVTVGSTANGYEVHGECNPGTGGGPVGADGFFECAVRAPLPLSTDGIYSFVTTASPPVPCGVDSPIDTTGVFRDTTGTHGVQGIGVSCSDNVGFNSENPSVGSCTNLVYCDQDENGVTLEFPRCVPSLADKGPNVGLSGVDACSRAAFEHYSCIAACATGYFCCGSTGGSCIRVGETCPCPT